MLSIAFQSAHQRRKLRPVSKSTSVSFRGTPFAAAIPGDGVVEQVFTTGISSFLYVVSRTANGRERSPDTIRLSIIPSIPNKD